jgi:hypothetical protein
MVSSPLGCVRALPQTGTLHRGLSSNTTIATVGKAGNTCAKQGDNWRFFDQLTQPM